MQFGTARTRARDRARDKAMARAKARIKDQGKSKQTVEAKRYVLQKYANSRGETQGTK